MSEVTTPILLILFNRPETTAKLIEAISKVKPQKIYIIIDGARINKVGEKEKCDEVRKIVEGINWTTTIYKKYFDENHGCDPTIEAGVSWMFEKEEIGIVLEDDCIPDPTFFTFAEKMLEKYKNNNKVMHVNGSNFQFGKIRGDGSYYFSRYAHSWGWATWKRAWQHYDTRLKGLATFKKNGDINHILQKPRERKFWLSFFEKLHENKFPFWDSKWVYNIWAQDGICITPNVNLIENIGWGKDATHTSVDEKLTYRPVNSIREIIDPVSSIPNIDADHYTFQNYYYRSFTQKILYKLRKAFNYLRR